MSIEGLDVALRDRLRAAGVYSVDSYGWKNEHEEDPNYIGYAMWTLEAPYDHASMERQERRPPAQRATVEQQRLIELGEDFHGVMKAAWHEIGLALMYRDDAVEHRTWDSRFECHVICTFVLLKIASDRARDFTIVAVLAEQPRIGREFDQFRLALCTAEHRGMTDLAHELRAVAANTETLRERRNAVVHKMTMDRTRVHSYLIEEERQAHDAGRWPRKRPDMSKIERHMNATIAFDKDEARGDIERSVQVLIGSYESVIKLGDLAFRLENHLRVRA